MKQALRAAAAISITVHKKKAKLQRHVSNVKHPVHRLDTLATELACIKSLACSDDR
jgi:hypothetical protein